MLDQKNIKIYEIFHKENMNNKGEKIMETQNNKIMKTKRRKIMKKTIICMLSTFVLFTNVAYGASTIKLINEAFVTKYERKDSGTVAKTLVPAKRVVPGDLVTYVISYENTGDEAASKVVIKNPIPTNSSYHSAEGNSLVSVDGGKNFGFLEKLSVQENGKTRAASEKDVTHVKWDISKPLQAKAQGQVTFMTRLR